uniref:CNNM transmembrane domain-containing protein n=1 Tax=Syphacia muris TaxID=451379 RepID=A0A158R641_9BILA
MHRHTLSDKTKFIFCCCFLKGMLIWLWGILHVLFFVNLITFTLSQSVANSSELQGYVESSKYHLSGIRVEPVENNHGFIGYKEHGVSLVMPDTPVFVNIFGLNLNEIQQVSFTTDVNNCSSTGITEDYEGFTVRTDERVTIRTRFPKSPDIYYICVSGKLPSGNEGSSTPFLVRISNFSVFSIFILKSRNRKQKQYFYFFKICLNVWNVHFATISTQVPPRKYYLPFGIQVACICCLLVFSGLFSGLNLGLMALTPQELMLIQKSGKPAERKYAETILPVRQSGNFLLCALLIGNVCVNSAVSILFDDLTSGYVALIVSSAGIVVFGEIFPQSLCVKKGLAVGARTIWITRFFMIVTFPLAYPISKVLDCILGDEVVPYNRKRLMELIKMSTRNEEGLAEELKIAVGAMEITDKTVKDVMTRIDDVFMLPDTTVLNTKTVAEILRMGYTRIPVYSGDRNHVVSLLFVKDLALLDPDDNFTIKTVCGYHEHPLRFVMHDTPLRVMLEEFKKGDYHLAMVQRVVQSEVSDPSYELVGIVTLEDIVEEILQAEIVDETDVVTDNVNRIRRRNAQARDLTYIFEHDGPSQVISVQMQLVAMQWLVTNHKAFNPELISQNVLEKIIKQHVRRVEFTHLPDMNDPKAVIPRTAKLYTKQEPSEKFILILEGRAIVTIGQNAMTFEAGPWHCFGGELLDRLIILAQQQGIISQQIPVSFSRNSLVGTSPSDAPKKAAASFIPDYSAVVRDDCTYLEITAQTYLLACKSTQLSKGSRSRDTIPHRFTVANLRSLHIESDVQKNGFIKSNHCPSTQSLLNQSS